MKNKVDMEEMGIKVASLKKSGKGDLVMKIKGMRGQTGSLAGPLKEEIVNKIQNVEVTVRRKETTFNILDIDSTATEDEVIEAVEKGTGISRCNIAFRGLRPSTDGNQIASIVVQTNMAVHLRKVRGIKIGWIMCRVKERAYITRCYRCLNYGHRT